MIREFKVIAVSSNTGSFGHNQHVLLAKDGTGFKVLKTAQFKHKVGDIIKVEEYPNGDFNWASGGYECPERILKAAPKELLESFWGNEVEPTQEPQQHTFTVVITNKNRMSRSEAFKFFDQLINAGYEDALQSARNEDDDADDDEQIETAKVEAINIELKQ